MSAEALGADLTQIASLGALAIAHIERGLGSGPEGVFDQAARWATTEASHPFDEFELLEWGVVLDAALAFAARRGRANYDGPYVFRASSEWYLSAEAIADMRGRLQASAGRHIGVSRQFELLGEDAEPSVRFVAELDRLAPELDQLVAQVRAMPAGPAIEFGEGIIGDLPKAKRLRGTRLALTEVGCQLAHNRGA